MVPVRRVVGKQRPVHDVIDVSWEEAVDAFLLSKSTRADNTVRFYRIQLRVLMQWAGEREISVAKFRKLDMDQFMEGRKQIGLKPTTRRHDAVAAKAFFKFCLQENFRRSNPLVDFKIPRATKPFRHVPTEAEIERLLRAVKDYYLPSKHVNSKYLPAKVRSFHARRNYAILAVLTDSACRVGEILSLRMEDVDIANRTLAVRETKGGEPRYLPISARVAEAMGDYIRVRPVCDSELLFISETGTQIDVSGFDKVLRRYLAFAGLKNFSPHSLRHFAITRLARKDVFVASRMAGHKSLNVTLLYLHSDPEYFREVHEQAAPLASVLHSKRKQQVKNLLR